MTNRTLCARPEAQRNGRRKKRIPLHQPSGPSFALACLVALWMAVAIDPGGLCRASSNSLSAEAAGGADGLGGSPPPESPLIHPVSGATVISAPGSYLVTQDITDGSGVTIAIHSDDVLLDLGGHMITQTGGGVGIAAAFASKDDSHVRVTNGSLLGGSTGVLLRKFDGHGGTYEIDHLSLSGQSQNGISFEGFSLSSPSVVVHHNTVRAAANAGILLNQAGASLVEDNQVTSCGTGILSTGTSLSASGQIVRQNTASQCGVGISLAFLSHAEVSQNLVVNSLSYGCLLGDLFDSTIASNQAIGNGADGYAVSTSQGNVFSGNEALLNGGSGMTFLGAGTSANSVDANTLSGNGACGITDTSGGANQIGPNTFSENALGDFCDDF